MRRYVLLDVFAANPLEGNQLAVFTDGRGLSPAQMQVLAAELKLSESVFLLPPESGGDVRVRIFTPAAELPFAGHPLLGSAVVLAAASGRPAVVLETAAGPVAVEIEPAEGRAVSATMSQPVPSWEPFAAEAELLKALGVERSGLPVEVYCNGPRHVYVELPSPEAVAGLRPDVAALKRVAGAVCVSCFAAEQGRVKTRMFAPGLGVEEDPATGSAAGPLALHLLRHGRIELGQEIEISQGQEIGRPSQLRARVQGSADRIASVHVAGSAVVLGRAELWLP
ncbi:MAG: PhzF family phenazine biosynthesis protein [Solirubrobacteraceae bacterium]